MNKVFDVIIVGGGPAGATAGLILARDGLDVLVLEKKAFPRFKLCGGMLTKKTIELGREILPGFLPDLQLRGIIEKKSKTYAIRSKNELLYLGRAEYPFIMVNREKYDFFWMEQLKLSGAAVSIDRAVRIDISKSRVITEAGKTYQGRFILGADGRGSRIRKALARRKIVQPPGSKRSALALETFVDRKSGSFSNHPELFFGEVRDGYAWSFPGSGTQVIGICSARIKDGRRLKDLLMELLTSQGVMIPGGQKIQANILPYGDYEKRPGYKNILLAGDAAGLAEPLLGEGIYYAHASGSLSARAVIECLNQPGRSCDVYAQFMGRIVSSMRKRLLFRKLTLGMPPFLAEKLFRSLLPLVAKKLESRIQGQHISSKGR